jgi:hypothetical protein
MDASSFLIVVAFCRAVAFVASAPLSEAFAKGVLFAGAPE